MCEYLSENVRRTMVHAIEKEEKIPLEYVTNLDEVVADIQDKFAALKVRSELLQFQCHTITPSNIVAIQTENQCSILNSENVFR